ncbi:HAMP domain-containing sensor histidine kinase [Paenibacillus qinlingensis]|uniref:Heme sensor protein HssS n=1 Tax=Paenibacillus qinlingensis TaxID=1837343 RepID=A0ABU1NZ92_9BACL|nr:HAMP domain-containing sensor histidine kinase [Paenibacillus qinlingensis]MDR6552396.1 signal transduction histidine kinase [Paenibacillus qinlingensis]
MIKSLYVRVVLTFLGAVIVSMMLGFYLNDTDQIRTYADDNMTQTGKKIIQAYVEAYPENTDTMLHGLSAFPLYSIRLFGVDGGLRYETTLASGQPPEIRAEDIKQVLQGGVFNRDEGSDVGNPMIGLPFIVDNQHYALFVAMNFEELGVIFGQVLRNELYIILLIGSVLIAIAARYVVRPLQRLTRATSLMAKGDFNVQLHSKRKDEIGQLTDSFNRMARELGAFESTRRQFVSDVSHEIQSPLTSIKGFTQALIHKKMDEPSCLRLLGIIAEESNRLSRLSEDLLQLSSLEYEHLKLNVTNYRLDEQLRGVIITLEPQWSIKSLDVSLEAEGLWLSADKDKLNQLWINLLGNAMKFTEAGGRVSVKVRDLGEFVLTTIADSGQGIPEGELDHIFKPFYKVDKSRDREIQGNGVGLSIVKRIIDLHNGEIGVASHVGEGTTITVRLPKQP